MCILKCTKGMCKFAHLLRIKKKINSKIVILYLDNVGKYESALQSLGLKIFIFNNFI